MGSIVLDLQEDVVSDKCDIVQSLRKAHLIAAKLDLTDFDKWIECELKGYYNGEPCPAYRKIQCRLKCFNPSRGWIPVLFEDSNDKDGLTIKPVVQSIQELVALSDDKNGKLGIECCYRENRYLNEISGTPTEMQFAYIISKASIIGIVEQVKNTLLEWTLQLEKQGILGENMTFDSKEKDLANGIAQITYNNYENANIINGSVEHSQILAGYNNVPNAKNEEVLNELSRFENELKKAKELSTADMETALEILKDIQCKVSSGKKSSIIKSLLVGLENFIITAGGGLTANCLHTMITRL